MGIGGIGDAYRNASPWDIANISTVDNEEKSQNSNKSVTSSGDSVEISSAAREMYEKMMARHGISSRTESEAGAEGHGGAIGGGWGGGANSEESIDEKIETLKSQLAGLAQQVEKGEDEAIQSKMNAIQAQISALETQKQTVSKAST